MESKTVFTPRSLTTGLSYELFLIDFDRYHNKKWSSINFYCKPFLMESANANTMAAYFLPNNKTCINLDQSGSGDVDPVWFNLISDDTPYTSKVCFQPKRKSVGSRFDLYVNVSTYAWFSVNTTVITAKHDLNVKEVDRVSSGSVQGISNACEAFNNKDILFSRIPCHSLSHTGLDDVQFKFAYDFRNEDNHLTFYLVATAPTGEDPSPKNLFEPIVGSRHGSFGIGIDMDYNLIDHKGHYFNFLVDVKYRYVFASTEKRSLDLKRNSNWSRYLLVMSQDPEITSQNAVNILTLPLQVSPRNTVDVWVAGHYEYKEFNVEFGYDFWLKQKEVVKLQGSVPSGYGIQSLRSYPATSFTSSTANITQSISGKNATSNDDTFVTLKDSNLNLNSAAQPGAHIQSIYIALGYRLQFKYLSLLLGSGAFFDVGVRNTLKQWSTWFVVGAAF